jgi:tetratricopeptide (TPR) repeat protein
MALSRDGKHQEALHVFDAIIASQPPDPSQALFVARLIDLVDGHWQAAKPYVQQLVRLRPSSFQAWELIIQVDQALGDLEDRGAAIQSL